MECNLSRDIRPFHERIAEKMETTPDAIAVIDNGIHVTFGNLAERVALLRSKLRAMGLRKGDNVAVGLPRSADSIAALLAVINNGAVYLPIDLGYPEERVKWMLQDAEPVVMLTSRSALEEFGFVRELVPCICVDESRAGDGVGDESLSLERLEDKDPAYVIYTSGSTGRPKGVIVPHLGISNRIQWELQTYPLGAADRILHQTSLSFDISLWEILVPLSAGACVVVADDSLKSDVLGLIDLLKRERVTAIALVPSLLGSLLEQGIRECGSLRHVHCGGERLTGGLVDAFFEQTSGVRLHNLYGPTEYSIDATYWDVDGPGGGDAPIGRPIANTQVFIFEEGREVPDVGVGEMWVSGAGLALGYLGQDELTADKFREYPAGSGLRAYRTGDVVSRDVHGVLRYVGRTDDQVKIRGHRLELGEVEAALRRCAGVAEAVATAVEDETAGEVELAVYVVLGAGGTLSDVRSQYSSGVPGFMRPAHWIELERLPLTPSGKIDRSSLTKPNVFTAVSDRNNADDLVSFIAGVVGRPELTRGDDLLDVGVSSLRLTRLVGAIKMKYDVDLTVHELFVESTVDSVCSRIEAALGSAP